MKKKIMLVVIFICSAFAAVYAQQTNIKRYYNENTGTTAYAYAEFLGDNIPIEKETIDDIRKTPAFATANIEEFKKLSKMDIWLCWRALNEHDFKEGQTYIVVSTDSLSSTHGIIVFLTMTNQGRDFKYRAFRCSN